MGLLVYSATDLSANAVPCYLRLQRFEVSKDDEDPNCARIQIRFETFLDRADEFQTPNLEVPRVFHIFAPYDKLFDIPLIAYIYYCYRIQLNSMGFVASDILEQNQVAYQPPPELEYPTPYQPTHDPYHYQFSSIVYWLSAKQPSPV
jgi:hypothetical protein